MQISKQRENGGWIAVAVVCCAILYGSLAGLRAGEVTTDPAADDDNTVYITQDDTVVFTAQSTNDIEVHIDNSTFDNGTPTFSAGDGVATATVTFTDDALGLENACTISVDSSATDDNGNQITCSSDKEIDFTVDVLEVTFNSDDSTTQSQQRNNSRNTDASPSVVSFLDEIQRVPPTKTETVALTVTPSIKPKSKTSIVISVDNNGDDDNGSATVTKPSNGELKKSGDVTVTGGKQTAPGHANQLKMVAKLNNKEAGRSQWGFTVAAWPCNFQADFLNDETGSKIGMKVNMSWESDSGDLNDLDQVKINEVVSTSGTPPSPPFLNTSIQANSTPFSAKSGSAYDLHRMPRANLAHGPSGNYTDLQHFVLFDARTGKNNEACDNSGYQIQRYVDPSGKGWTLTTSKDGSGAEKVDPGSGSANSSAIPY